MAKRILIAEDDAISREMLISAADAHGYEVVAVADGIDLLNLAVENTFDVIITDLMMANLSGASAAEMLQSQGITTPVIALTALSPEEISLVKDDFVRVFYKPCDFEELFRSVDSLLGS